MADWTYTRITPKTDEADGKYYGIVDMPPTTGLLKGDSCVQKQNGELVIKAWDGYRWVSLEDSNLSNAEQSVICGKAQKDVLEAVEMGTVTSSEYGYFRSLIAGVVSADYIKAMEGLFDSIVVTGNSFFYGNFDCPTIESMPNQSGTTYTKSVPAMTSSSDYSQYNALRDFWVDTALESNFYYQVTIPQFPTVAYVARKPNGSSFIWQFLTQTMQSVVFEVKWLERGVAGTSTAFTLNLIVTTGDILKIKGLQEGKLGLQTDQVYYTVMNGHKVLCLV